MWSMFVVKTYTRESMMKIAILGTGNVGSALGKRWAAKGHTILFGSRDPHSPKVRQLVLDAGPTASAHLPAEAAGGAEVLLLATPFHSTQEYLRGLALNGKILIDATNPLGEGLKLITWSDSSAAEQIAGWAIGARVVKAFNSTGSGNMANASYGETRPALFYCGDDPDAKAVVKQLAEESGFAPVDSGPLSSARLLEPLGGLWVTLAYLQGQGPNQAFALLRR
jgi:8-hydroxy-5-deazaflavin:NADPH oxidoreductase